MKILLAAASQLEIQQTLEYLEKNWEKKNFWEYRKGEVTVTSLVMGIGGVFSAFSLARQQNLGEYNYVINPGIGAGLSRILDIGRVYLIESEGFGDIGLEEADGTFHNLHSLNWQPKDTFPFTKGRLTPKKLINPTYLPRCKALTVNKIPGIFEAIEKLQKQYHMDMLSIDGAAIMYACNMLELDLIQIKVVGRYVEPWQKITPSAPGSVEQLNMRTIDIIESLANEQETLKEFSIIR